MSNNKRVANPARAGVVDSNGHRITGNPIRGGDSISVHGRSASKMSVAETNAQFERLKKEQCRS